MKVFKKIVGQFLTEKYHFEIQDLAILTTYLKIMVSHGGKFRIHF
jgi:hypothetical protein